MTVGILGRVSCKAVTVSQPSFTTSPDTATITDWDTIEARGPSWVSGGSGPYQGMVPVAGRYLVLLFAEVSANDAGAAIVEAGFLATFAGVALGLFAPAFPVDDTNGTAWVAASASAIVDLAVGDPLDVSIASHDSDASLAALGIHRVELSMIRL